MFRVIELLDEKSVAPARTGIASLIGATLNIADRSKDASIVEMLKGPFSQSQSRNALRQERGRTATRVRETASGAVQAVEEVRESSSAGSSSADLV